MKTLPNALRDIGYAISYLNGESMKDLSIRSGLTVNRMSIIVRDVAFRARQSITKETGFEDKEGILLFSPKILRQNREYVVKVLRWHEAEIQKQEAEVTLDDPLVRLHLPAKTQLILSRCFPTIRDLVAHLNNNGGEINVTGLSVTAKPAVKLRLMKFDLSKHLKHKEYVSVPDIFKDVLRYLKEPETFTAADKDNLQNVVETRLNSYKSFRSQ